MLLPKTLKTNKLSNATEGTKILQKQNLSKIVTSAYTSSTSDLHWTLLQFGGANTHIQLTAGEGDVSLIPNFQDLSESLGFYNISQSHPGNSKILCSGFAKNFISKSSLKDNKTFNDNQYKQIMYNIIDYKTNIDGLLKNSSITNSSKDYSVRYLLDNNQNIISVSYYQYDKSNLNIEAHLNINHTFSKETPSSGEEFGIPAITMFKWNDYADSWNNFIFLYPSFTVDKTSEINYTVAHKNYKVRNTELSFQTNVILNKPEGSKQPIWKIDVEPEPSKFAVQGLLLWMYMWHDEQYVYEGFQATSQSHNFDIGANFSVNINQWIINNFLNN
ncbi:hypothetical protein [Spiroplasma endosymbiont of Nebria brevicollis]|uniref:hypothetical protein n=1 Tax=Spiroplasma endosymbiont of Nebria brevicollis TaxID=3066284 RepID=UPI00313A8399